MGLLLESTQGEQEEIKTKAQKDSQYFYDLYMPRNIAPLFMFIHC